MPTYKITTSPEKIDSLWEALPLQGITPLYSEEENRQAFLLIQCSEESLTPLSSLSVEPIALPTTDWEKQWQEHCPFYQEGTIVIDLSLYGPKEQLLLTPGAGFGDLSHPTTELTMQMMAPFVSGKNIVDLGCGSGVLSIAAVKWGAKSVLAIDIDPESVQHTKENSALNQINTITALLAEDLPPYPSSSVLVCNMIRSEQKQALLSHPAANYEWAITSGILLSEKNIYLKQMAKLGWKLHMTKEKDGWFGAVFHSKKNNSLR